MNLAGNYKKVLVSFVQVVVFLFVAFGGFLKNIAPPNESGAYSYVGIASFLTLIVLLVISAVARRAPGSKYRRGWVYIGIVCLVLAIGFAVFYPRVLDWYTYPSPEHAGQLRVKGSDQDLVGPVKEWLADQPIRPSPGELARKFPPDQVWTKESIEHAKTVLLLSYGALVLTLATAVFCLIEANADGRSQLPVRRRKTKKAV
jgi:hypothetical protein